jgi:hypothetical protein
MTKFKINDRVRLNGLMNTHLTQFDDIGTITRINSTGYVVELNGATYHAMKDRDLKLVERAESNP